MTAATTARSRGVVLSWIPFHGRSEGLAEGLGLPAVWMPWAGAGSPAATAVGYLRSAARTVRVVLALPRGALVVVMCPPVFAVLVAVLAGRVRGVRVVADLHSGALNDPRWAWSRGLLRWCAARCSGLVVTNLALLEGSGLTGRPVVVLHDPPTSLVPGGRLPDLGDRPLVVFPASGAADEPLSELVAAARLLGDRATVVVTGRHPALADEPAVRLPGFLDTEVYAQLLARADVVLALTTREATMQRAGYEALELGRPLVCSDTAVLREAFGSAAVFTAADPQSLADAVLRALADGERLSAATTALRDRMHADTTAALGRLAALV